MPLKEITLTLTDAEAYAIINSLVFHGMQSQALTKAQIKLRHDTAKMIASMIENPTCFMIACKAYKRK